MVGINAGLFVLDAVLNMLAGAGVAVSNPCYYLPPGQRVLMNKPSPEEEESENEGKTGIRKQRRLKTYKLSQYNRQRGWVGVLKKCWLLQLKEK